MGLDYRIQKWGKWRPSAVAKKLGSVAVDLETLLYRDGHSFSGAVEILRSLRDPVLSRSQLEDLAGQLPVRFSRRMESEESIATFPSRTPTPEDELFRKEGSGELEKAFRILRRVLPILDAEERTILRLHFEEQFQWKEIAKSLGFEQKQLYRIKDRAIRKLRTELQERGISNFPWLGDA